jgi:hypothetical protein
MKLLIALTLALGVIGGAVAISMIASSAVVACDTNCN